MLTAIRYAREQEIPFLGICLGLQCAVIEYARNVVNLPGSDSYEFKEDASTAVVGLMDSQMKVTNKGGTMRLGAYPASLKPGSRAAEIYGTTEISERHRHRFEVNNDFRPQLEEHGMLISGTSPDGQLVEMVELPEHPFFVAGQFHPELKSRPMRPAPLFAAFIEAAVARAQLTHPSQVQPIAAGD